MKEDVTMDEFVLFLVKHFPGLYKDMRDSEHAYELGKSHPFHIEGSVWTHTMLVCNFVKNCSYINDPRLYLSALLHDIGKPACRMNIEVVDKETGKKQNKVSFKGHEGYSVFLAIEVLDKLIAHGMISASVKTDVLTLISWHSVIFDHFIKGNEIKPATFVNKFSNHTLYDIYIQLSRADSMGRIYISSDEQRCEYAKKLGVKSYNYNTWDEHFKPILKYDERLPSVTVLVGPPSSGKTTWVEQFIEKNPDYVVISRDSILLEYGKTHFGLESYTDIWDKLDNDDQSSIDKQLMNLFNKAQRDRKNIIIDMTNMSRKSRRKWIQHTHYEHKAVVFLNSFDVLMQRNLNIDYHKKQLISFIKVE
jgi:predicted kinase